MPRILAAAFVLSLCSVPVTAGPGGSSIVEREIARREGLVARAQELIAEGDAARKAKDFAAAVAAYRQAYEILPPAATTIELRGRALHAFSEVSVVHAETLAMEARYDEANAALDAVLLPDWNPEYKPALKLKQQIQDPEHYNPAATPAHLGNVAEVDRLLRLAQGHFDLGEFDLAAEHFNRVLAVDRYNVAARRGLEKVERRISQYHEASRDHTRASMLRAVDAQWETPVPASLQLNGGLASHPALGGEPLAAGLMVREKLHTLIVPQIQLLDATLEEAVQYVASISRTIDTVEPDPGKKGINIVLSGDATLANKRLSINLQNVPLEYVLETMARDAGTGLQIGDYLVTIGPNDPTALETRTYRVPPNFFTASAPASVGGGDPFSGGGEGASSNLAFTRLSAQDILTQNGVSFPEGASATFSPATGLMTVRNTPENHETIRNIVDSVAATAPKMVRLQCNIIEVNQENSEEIGFDWLLGQFNIGGSAKVFGGGGTTGNQVGGTAQNFPFVPPTQDAQPVGQYPLTAGNRSGNGAIQPNSIDSLLAGQRGVDLSLKAPGVFGLAGVYTDATFQVVLRGINQRKGVDILSTPEVTTKSGHRARVEVVRDFIYPTEFEPPEIPQDFGNGGGASFINLVTGQGFSTGGSGGAFPVTPTMPTTFESKKLGHVFEVEATVGPDNRTIDIDVLPSYSDFEGFVNYGTPIQTYVSSTQAPIVLTPNEILQPVFKSSRSDGPIKVTLFSGATMVIAALNMEETQSVEDKTPILGDLPFIGQLFRTHAKRIKQKAVVFSIKATVVDPAGETPQGTLSELAGQ